MTDLRKAESELDEGLRLGALLWPRKMAAELRRLHEENEALRQALAQPEQKPVASDAYDMIDRFLRNNLDDDEYAKYLSALETIYTAPPKREWVGLTDADKQEACIHMQKAKGGFANIKSLEFIERCWEFADYLDAKLKEKNT